LRKLATVLTWLAQAPFLTSFTPSPVCAEKPSPYRAVPPGAGFAASRSQPANPPRRGLRADADPAPQPARLGGTRRASRPGTTATPSGLQAPADAPFHPPRAGSEPLTSSQPRSRNGEANPCFACVHGAWTTSPRRRARLAAGIRRVGHRALERGSKGGPSGLSPPGSPLTQLTRTYLGRPELGSFTRQKAYITFPLLSSSTISSRPPSARERRETASDARRARRGRPWCQGCLHPGDYPWWIWSCPAPSASEPSRSPSSLRCLLAGAGAGSQPAPPHPQQPSAPELLFLRPSLPQLNDWKDPGCVMQAR